MKDSIQSPRPLISVCIPAFNRARHLPALLDSIFEQDFRDFEIVICEDGSPERDRISDIVSEYQCIHPRLLRYFENSGNLGYDANIRNLVEKSAGRFCFFMGNDDLMCKGALSHAASLICQFPRIGMILKAYAWFDRSPEQINQEIRYFSEVTEIGAGPSAIRYAFRRSGVISGYIIDRDQAFLASTDRFDGTLYYQMHLTANVLIDKSVVVTPQILVLCRNGEPPDFGKSTAEEGKYIPGRYTPEARLSMIKGALSIIECVRDTKGVDVVADVRRDFANYFYPYIKDQLDLPWREYWSLYRAFSRMGFSRYPLFHVYFALGRILREKQFDALTSLVRRRMGRSPRLIKV